MFRLKGLQREMHVFAEPCKELVHRRLCTSRALAVLAVSALAVAQGKAGDIGAVEPPFKEGDVITFDKIDSLKPFLPPEFWNNHDYFFYEGMKLEIGPFFRDYTPAAEYQEATKEYAGLPKIGPNGGLENYTAGQPFPIDEIDCKGDPQAGVKIMWDFDYQWEGDNTRANYLYSYWDHGEQLPLNYEGSSTTIQLSHLAEAEYRADQGGDVFRDERRKSAFGVEVTSPFDARGINLLTFRYKSSDGPLDQAKNDDTWVYLPALRRVRRISTAQRSETIAGTDFAFDDLRSFAGTAPQYEWICLGEQDLIAPMNSRVRAYPYSVHHDFGPAGLSYADDRWELRHIIKVQMKPKNRNHPYDHKDIYIDKQSMVAVYSFAFDHTKKLWKIIWHNHRWSEDDPTWYPGWNGVPEPRDNRDVSDIIVNVQTGTGNRIEFWDSRSVPLSRGQIRRLLDYHRNIGDR
jgi:hypothetical protein